MGRLSETLTASATWNPSAILDGNEEATDVTVAGAQLGDFALASLGVDVSDLSLTADVTAANTVTAVLANSTGSTVDLISSTLRIVVIPKEIVDNDANF